MRKQINKVKNFGKFLNEIGIHKDTDDIIIYETKLSRIWKYIEENEIGFGVISPFRKEYNKEENLIRFQELKNIVRNELKLGFIELKGGFFEEDSWVNEKSLFIPKIKKQDLIELGEYFEQYSIIFKDKNEFIEIGTNSNSGVGKTLNNFKRGEGRENMQIDSDLTDLFFSQIAKGSHRDKKFLFNINEMYLLEVDEKTFNDMYREIDGKKQIRHIKLL